MSRWSFSLADAPLPLVAVEIASHRVSAASVEGRAGRAVVAAHAMQPLAGGGVVPSLTAANVHDRGAVISALKRVLEAMGNPRQIGLIVPDPVAKVSLVKFQQVPARASDLDQLIRWQARKSAPFPIEEGLVSYVRGAQASDGQEFIVSLARREVVAEYEGLCAEAGAHAGLVDLSTFNVVNAVLAGATGAPADWLLVNVAPDWASIAILRGSQLLLFRSRTADADGTLADLAHQTAMYYEDRLNGTGFARVLMSGASSLDGASADVEPLRRNLSERLGTPVESVNLTAAAALTDRIAGTPALFDALAPLVGLLLRDREAA